MVSFLVLLVLLDVVGAWHSPLLIATTRGSMQLSMSSSASAAKDKDTPLNVKVADKVISTLFSIKPLFKIASTKARSSMIERGLKIDVDWQKNVKSLQADIEILSKEFDGVKNSKLVYPDYYLKPFHAYDDGNLSWQAAMEVESAALTVHAPIFTATKTELDRNGDFTLRDNFHKNMLKMFVAKGFRPKRILDIGCSTGLSTLKLAESFPDSQIIGLDLSPYMLAVAKHQLYSAFKDAKVTYMHGCGEDTGLGSNDVDLVSMCLINHELPSDVSKQIFQEAYRVLPSGGVISIMDMNPRSLFFQKFAANPFAFTAFKSTEPWIQEYVSMDLEQTLAEVGFTSVGVLENSPRHRTVVAYK